MDYGILAISLGAVGLLFAFILFLTIKKKPAGNDVMIELSDIIHDGAMVFLKREYTILAVFIVIVFSLLSWKIGLYTGIAFVSGAACLPCR